jgi:hypothetical protein
MRTADFQSPSRVDPTAGLMDVGLQQALDVFLGGANRPVFLANGESHPDSKPLAVLKSSSSGAQARLLRSAGFTSIREFALLPSIRAIRWMIPVGDSNCTLSGLEIYRPYASGARLAKRLLAAVTRMGYTGWARRRVIVASREPLRLESLVREVTGEIQPVFALSLGTARRFRELTIQVMRSDGDVLGYVKLPMTAEAVECVRREAAMLDHLYGYPALSSQIPRVLHAGVWDDGYVLFQSAGPLRTAPVEFGEIHQDFLMKLRGIEPIEKPGKVLLEEVTARWRKAETKLDSNWRALGSDALHRASHELEKRIVHCGVTHGDFAPWNSSVEHGSLYVFDWESASCDAPSSWDVFHFHVQVASLLKKNHFRFPLSRTPEEKGCFLLYLLNSVCRYLDEEAQDGDVGIDYRRTLLRAELSQT